MKRVLKIFSLFILLTLMLTIITSCASSKTKVFKELKRIEHFQGEDLSNNIIDLYINSDNTYNLKYKDIDCSQEKLKYRSTIKDVYDKVWGVNQVRYYHMIELKNSKVKEDADNYYLVVIEYSSFSYYLKYGGAASAESASEGLIKLKTLEE